MSTTNKPRVIKDYEKLPLEILEAVKLVYPRGYRKHLIEFTGIDGLKRKGLPFETPDKIYLIRMTVAEAVAVIEKDDDFDNEGNLKSSVQEKLSDKYDEEDDFFTELNSNEDNEFGDEFAYTDDEIEEMDSAQ